jgi:hypothetical protein
MSLWNVFRNNKQNAAIQNAQTLSEFMALAINYIRDGAEIASCDVTLPDGTPISIVVAKRISDCAARS